MWRFSQPSSIYKNAQRITGNRKNMTAIRTKHGPTAHMVVPVRWCVSGATLLQPSPHTTHYSVKLMQLAYDDAIDAEKANTALCR